METYVCFKKDMLNCHCCAQALTLDKALMTADMAGKVTSALSRCPTLQKLRLHGGTLSAACMGAAAATLAKCSFLTTTTRHAAHCLLALARAHYVCSCCSSSHPYTSCAHAYFPVQLVPRAQPAISSDSQYNAYMLYFQTHLAFVWRVLRAYCQAFESS